MIPVKFCYLLCLVLILLNILAFFHFYIGRPENRYFEVVRIVRENVYPTSAEINDVELTRPNDFHTLLNLTNFDYLITKSPVKQIKDANNVTLPNFVILIHTNPYHEALRKSIRETWSQSDPRALTYFMLGAVNTTEKQAKIEAEDFEYNDIIQGNFFDSYRNLTYKHVMCLKWFKDNCPGVKYMVKLDDDVYTNVPAVYEFLQRNKPDQNFLMGLYRAPELIMRAAKWKVTDEEYLDDWYPPYVYGNMIIYSADLVLALYERAKTTRFHWIDDVYITGMVRTQLNNRIVPIYDYLLDDEDKENETAVYSRPDFMFSKHSTKPIQMRWIWNKTSDYRHSRRYIAPGENMEEHSVY